MQAQSALAMLQQKERDNVRLFFKQRNYPFLFALPRKCKQPTADFHFTDRINYNYIRHMKKYLLLFVIATAMYDSFSQTLDAEQIYKKVNAAVVTVYAYDSEQKILSQGSGVVLNDKGWVVTNYHVYNGADKLIVKQKEKVIEYSQIIGVDADKDILILKIADNTFPYITVGNSDLLNVGQKIYAIGSPEGFENTITEGIISGLRSYENYSKNYIQISAPLSHGSSGGAVVNSKGELIGISTFSVVAGQNLNFAIPINELQQVYKINGVNKNDLTSADYFMQGLNFWRLGKRNDAIFSFSKCIEIDPEDASAFYSRGLVNYELEKYQQAISDYDRAIQIKPNSPGPHYARGQAKVELKDIQGAIEDYSKEIEIDPKSSRAYYERGFLRAQLYDYKAALLDLNVSLEINPKTEKAYSVRGACKYFLKDYDGSISDYNKTIDSNPNDGQAYMYRAISKVKSGQKQSGCSDFGKAGELGVSAAYEAMKQYCN